MTRDEAVKMLQATRLMLTDGANQPISDLYYALDMAIEALEQTEPTNSEKPNNCEDEDIFEYCPRCGMRILVSKQKDEPQTDCLEQFRVGLEYHTDTTHFGKVKGENITTNKVKTEPQTDCAWK